MSVPSDQISVLGASRSIPSASKSVGVFILSNAGRTDGQLALSLPYNTDIII